MKFAEVAVYACLRLGLFYRGHTAWLHGRPELTTPLISLDECQETAFRIRSGFHGGPLCQPVMDAIY